jgi:hypothetical protein
MNLAGGVVSVFLAVLCFFGSQGIYSALNGSYPDWEIGAAITFLWFAWALVVLGIHRYTS